MVKIIQKVSLSVTDGNVDPWQFLPCLVRRNNFGDILLNRLIKFTIARIVIGFNFGFRAQTIFNHSVDCFGSKIRHYPHFKIFTTRRRAMVFRVLSFLGLSHDQHRGLFFAATTSLQFFLFPAFHSRINRFKESQIYFCKSGKFIALITGSHRNSNLVNHKPNWLRALTTKLSLHFLRRNTFIGRGHQMHSSEPITDGKIRGFYYRPASQSCAGSSFFTLKLFNRFDPIMRSALAINTCNALILTLFPKRISARLFVGILFEKIYKFHIRNFESKLLRLNVTYLRYGT